MPNDGPRMAQPAIRRREGFRQCGHSVPLGPPGTKDLDEKSETVGERGSRTRPPVPPRHAHVMPRHAPCLRACVTRARHTPAECAARSTHALDHASVQAIPRHFVTPRRCQAARRRPDAPHHFVMGSLCQSTRQPVGKSVGDGRREALQVRDDPRDNQRLGEDRTTRAAHDAA
jgi:hypothetical protein